VDQSGADGAAAVAVMPVGSGDVLIGFSRTNQPQIIEIGFRAGILPTENNRLRVDRVENAVCEEAPPRTILGPGMGMQQGHTDAPWERQANQQAKRAFLKTFTGQTHGRKRVVTRGEKQIIYRKLRSYGVLVKGEDWTAGETFLSCCKILRYRRRTALLRP